MLKKAMTYSLIVIFSVSLCGCDALQRKFARKKQKEVRSAPVITTFDYSKDLRADELYKKHFLFWKSWQTELIDRMDGGYKKRTECYDFTISSLMEMRKYLKGPKAAELDKFIIEIKSIDPDVKKERLSKSELYRMRQLLESSKRRIDRKFSYNRVRDYVELQKNR